MSVMTAADTSEFVTRISAAWSRSVEAIFETGRLIAEAKAALPHGAFQRMIDSELPFGARTAQKLMRVARDKRLTSAGRVSSLPANWSTLSELTKLTDAALEAGFVSGAINPDMYRKDIKSLSSPPLSPPRVIVAADLRTLSGRRLADLSFGELRAMQEQAAAEARMLGLIRQDAVPDDEGARVGDYFSEDRLRALRARAEGEGRE